VKRPRNISVPPTISIMLARPSSETSGTPPRTSAAGKPKNFWVPCATKRKAATTLRRLRRYGAHRAGIGPLIGALLFLSPSPA
jgi:hypothetical protein